MASAVRYNIGKELAELIIREMDTACDAVNLCTDRMKFVGSIHIKNGMFSAYVSNTAEHIRSSTRTEQWHYVPSGTNPADIVTRIMSQTRW